MRTLVIIPTYNESENIRQLVPEVLARPAKLDILVVDDNSPDGTGEVVRQMQRAEPRLHLLVRSGKEGLGKAYLAGFRWALDNGYEAVVEMDADFSHRPVDLDQVLAGLNESDFVVGSRWISGGGTENWGLGRKIISRGGSLYSRIILGYPLHDWTGGFNAWRVEVLRGIELERVRSEGYSFQIELKYRALKRGFRGLEVPILFSERRVGQSKMSIWIVVEALHRVWRLRLTLGGRS